MIRADECGDAFLRIVARATVADALHQTGELAEAGALFVEAERIQKERQPEFDLLHSVQGFQYCDWLLAPTERIAWRAFISSFITFDRHNLDQTCAEVEQRAVKTLAWAEQSGYLLDIALSHLTLARVGLIRMVLIQPAHDLPNISAAIHGLRNSGQIAFLPIGLLSAALYSFKRGDADEACRYLNEAQQISERGPMPLYLADVFLHRARFFHDKGELLKARGLVDSHDYWRRKQELEDAEAAAVDW
jgi:hypothetical protein